MLNKRQKYGDDWGVPSAEHPAGECLNRSAPGVEDGSYFEKSWVNDLMALSGALMNSAGYAPNGIEDTATACQVFDALVNNRWTAIGNYSVGTIVTASNGKQYLCKKLNGRDSTAVDPSSVTDRIFWVQFPYEAGSNTNGEYKIHHDGSIEQWGRTPNTVGGIADVTFPIPFTGNSDDIKITFGDISSAGNVPGVSCFGRGGETLTGFEALAVVVTSSTPADADSASYYAFSRG